MKRTPSLLLGLGLCLLAFLGACASPPEAPRGAVAEAEEKTEAAAAGAEAGAAAGAAAEAAAAGEELPPLPSLPREFRGLWVASAYGLDWPSRPGLSAAELAAEADRILDLAASLRLNAILLQVRPAGDTLYASSIEPWSAALAGVQGLPPPEGFDPLAYWLAGARSRGLLLFAWINPFRAGLAGVPPHPSSPRLSKPELVREIGKGLAWLDPGLPESRDYVVSVALDLVRRYAPDGLVVDDYLYPYPSLLGPGEAFPDAESYAAYREGGGGLGLEAWRVENGNLFMRSLSGRLREASPGLVLGASPFGIYRSGEPPETRGLSGREATGVDALAWSAEGLVDFISPQLYWPITALEQSFPLLLAWWREALASGEGAAQGSQGAALWPSIAPAALRLEPSLKAHEALSELMVTRAMLERRGIVVYSARALLDEANGIARALAGALRTPALPPGLGDPRGEAGPGPGLALGEPKREEGGLRVGLACGPSARFLVLSSLWRKGRGRAWRSEIKAPIPEAFFPLESGEGRLEALAFQVADARGRLSEPLFLRLPDSADSGGAAAP